MGADQLHVAAGRPWTGRKVRQAGVVYVAAEAGRGMRKRIVAALDHHAFPRSLPFALVDTVPDLGHPEGDADRLAREIADQVPEGFRVGLIVVDTLARTMAGCDESGSAGMGLFVENVERLGRSVGALVLAVHHSGKDLERGMRGSSALLGAADAVWRIVAADEDREVPLHVRVEKMKEDEGLLALPFALERVEMADGPDGEPRTTCVVVHRESEKRVAPPSEPPARQFAPKYKPSSGEAAFIPALTAVIDRHGATVQRFRHIPAEVKVIEQAKLADFKEFPIVATSRKSRQSQIDKLLRNLESTGTLRRHAGYVWLVGLSD